MIRFEEKIVFCVSIRRRRLADGPIWVRPFGRLVYLMPPYIIGQADLEKLTNAVAMVIRSGV